MEIAAKLFDPIFKYLYERHITIFVAPFIVASIYAYFLFWKRPKGKSFTIEEIMVIIGWLFCFILGVIDQYDMIMKMLNK